MNKMKQVSKRVLSCLLTLAMLLALLPMTSLQVKAAGTPTRLTALDLTSNTGEDKLTAEGWKFEKANGTASAENQNILTLNNMYIQVDSQSPLAVPAYTKIVLNGVNKIESTRNAGAAGYGIRAYGSIYIEGEGSLEIIAGISSTNTSAAFYMTDGNFYISSGTLIATALESPISVGLRISGSINLSGGTVIAKGTDQGFLKEPIISTDSKYWSSNDYNETVPDKALWTIGTPAAWDTKQIAIMVGLPVANPSIDVGTQSDKLTYGTSGDVTYSITAEDFDTFNPSVVWTSGSAPAGVSESFTNENTILKLSVDSTVNVGTYAFKVKSGDTESEEATLVIDEAEDSGRIPVIISGVTVDSKTYDGTAITKSGTPVANDGTSSVDISDYDYDWQNANGDTLAEAPKDAGSYKLRISVSDSNDKYSGSKEIDFSINKASITITADNKTANVGDSAPAYTYTVNGLVAGDSLKTNPTLTCTPDMNKAGTYAITPSDAAVPEGGNYENTISYAAGTLTVQAVGTTFIAVTDIKDVPASATVGTSLTLNGTVEPSNATNKTIQWTVKENGTTGATISDGKLETTGSGTAVVTATIQNGKTATESFTKDFTINVSYPVEKGSTYTVSGYKYKVTSITNSKKEVSFVGLTTAKKKTTTTLNIKNTVKINGITLKVTAVGKNAIQKNTKVSTIKIGNNVQTIGFGAFSQCTALKSITIGKGLKTIAGHVFCQDAKLKNITIQSTKLKHVKSTHVFSKVKATIKVPASKVSAYQKLFKGKEGSLKIKK